MNIDSILTEWSYRLPKGYPTRSKDYELLYHVILEMTNLTPLEARIVVNKAQGLNEQDESNILDFKQLNLSDDLRMQIEDRYEQLSPTEKEEFNKNYRKHSIQSYMNTGYKPFIKFYDILPTGKAAAGMGKGEIQTLLAVAESQPGGTVMHDIVMPAGEWEVKEIGKLPRLTKSGEMGKAPEGKTFRPAKSGFPVEGDLLTQTNTFFTDIVKPLSEMGDSFEELKDLVDPHSWKQLNELIDVIQQLFIPLSDNVTNGEVSYKSGWSQMYKGWQLIHDILWKTDLDTDIHDTRLTIKTGNDQFSYWITADDFKKIQSAAGDVSSISINIGQQITNETNNAAIWFNKLKHHNLVKNPNLMIELLNNTKNRFFSGILGLIAYDVNRPGIPIVTTSADWAIIGLSQGMWTFGLKSVYPKYDFIQQQS
jgi:hypothetical protein